MEILDEFNGEQLIKLIQFVTGGTYCKESIKILQNSSKNSLISVSTCSCVMFIGTYDNKEVLKKKLIDSMYNSEGFHKR